jgi:hypothetical protein
MNDYTSRLYVAGVFLTLVMTLNAVSLVCATLVINVKKQSDMCFCPSVPRPVLTFCRAVLGRLTCTSYSDVDYGGGPRHPVASCVDAMAAAAAADSSGDGRLGCSAAPSSPPTSRTNGARRLTVPARHEGGNGTSVVVGSNCKTECSGDSLSPAARSVGSKPCHTADDAIEHFRRHRPEAPDVVVSSSSDRRSSGAGDVDDFRFQRLQRRRCRRLNGADNQLVGDSDGNFEMKTYVGATPMDDETDDVIRKTNGQRRKSSVIIDS